MVGLPHPTWLRAFEAAARHGSFTAAADELGLTAAAVSQQIRLLEAHLNATLFERLARGVALTDTGQAYAQPIRKGFADMQAATAGLFGRKRSKSVRVRASISCATLIIAPRLHEFQRLHPDVDVDLATFVWADRFNDELSDIDIRFGYGDWADGTVTHLGHEYAVPVCGRAYAGWFDGGPKLQDLAAGPVFTVQGSETDWPRLMEQAGQPMVTPAHVTRVDSSLLALQSISSGPGAVIVLESFAASFLAQNQIIKPLPYRLSIQPSHWMVVRDTASARSEVSLFANWICTLFQVRQQP